MSPSDHRQPSHLAWIDCARFVAAMLVVLAHARAVAFLEYGALEPASHGPLVAVFFLLTRIANEAVVLFFVLSGYLVGGRAIQRAAQGGFDGFDFAIDRAVRIYLPLLPALALTALVRQLTGGAWSFPELAVNLVGLQGTLAVPWGGPFGGNSPLWSLAYESWFYLLTLVVAESMARRRLRPPGVLVLLAFGAVFTVLDSTYLFCWLVGAVARLTMPERASGRLLLVALAMSLVGVALVQLGMGSVSVKAEHWQAWLPNLRTGRLILATGLALLVQQLVMRPPQADLSQRLEGQGSRLAAWSYSLYLVHYPVLQYLQSIGLQRAPAVNPATMALWAGAVAVCSTTAWLSYALFESRTQAVRERLRLLRPVPKR